MAYSDVLKRSLTKEFPAGRVVYMKGWASNYTGFWPPVARTGGFFSRFRRRGRRPVALLLHHTAAAATESSSPGATGNRKGANNGVIRYIQNHYRVPAANFTLDRDGTVYVHAANPVWHSGLGTFKGKEPWDSLNIPDDEGNRFMLGVEIMSKGRRKDYTEAQKESLASLIDACADSAGWKPLWLKNRPRHKDWTSRKIDILYTNDEVKDWIVRYET